MPSGKQLVDLPFSAGIDTKTDERSIMPGTQTGVVNGIWQRANAIIKRNGYTRIADPGVPNRPAEHDGDLIANAGKNLLRYSTQSTTWRTEPGELGEAIATRKGITGLSVMAQSWDIAITSTHVIYAWVQRDSAGAGKVVASVERTDGTRVYDSYSVATTSATAGAKVRVFAIGTKFWFAYTNAGGTTFTVGSATFECSTETWGASATTAINVQNALIWDASPIEGTTRFVTATEDPAGTMSVKVWDTSPAVLYTYTVGAPSGAFGTPIRGLCVQATSSDSLIWVGAAWTVTAAPTTCGLYGYCLSSTATLSGGPTIISTFGVSAGAPEIVGCTRTSSTTAVFLWSLRTNTPLVGWCSINSSGTGLYAARSDGQMALESRPFYVASQDRTYAVCTMVGGTGALSAGINDSALALVDLRTDLTSVQNARVVATAARRIVRTYVNSSRKSLPSVVRDTAHGVEWITASNVLVNAQTQNGISRIGFDFETPGYAREVQLGPVTYLSGGVVSCYDGARAVELHANVAPLISNVVASNGAGSLSVSTTYTYYVMQSWTDRKGNSHQSPVTTRSVTTGAADDTVTLSGYVGPTLKVDATNSTIESMRILIYRASTATGGAPYLVAQFDSCPWVSSGGTWSYTDLVSDATLISNAYGFLPTYGGRLEAQAPPSLRFAIVHANRLWGVGDDSTTLWFSSSQTDGEVVRFNDVMTYAFADGGDVVGLGSLDAALIVFKAGGVYAVSGSGPNDLGEQSDFAPPRQLPGPGCIESRSVVSTPVGIFYQSAQGLYLVGRGFDISYAGKAVEGYLQTYPVITSAVYLPAQGEVRFSCRASESSTTGYVLVFNLTLGNWSIFDMTNPGATAGNLYSPKAATAVDGVYTWVSDAGRIVQENQTRTAANACTDWGNYVSINVESAWARSQGFGGWGEFYRGQLLALSAANHNLTIKTYFDFSESSTPMTKTWTRTLISLFATPLEVAELQIGRKAGAVKFEIYDAAPDAGSAGTGAGPELLGLQLEFAPYPGQYRLAAEQKG